LGYDAVDVFSHLTGEVSVGFYQAPDDAKVTPALIPNGFEFVEVLTGGVVYFEVDGVRRRFGRGAIFWHIAGDYTISETSSERPYRCMVFKFSASKRSRLWPRVGDWGDINGLDQFTEEALSSFHRLDCDIRLLSAYLYSALAWRQSISRRVDFERKERHSATSKAIKFIEDHYSETITVGDVARFAGISKSHLFTLFREDLGQGPHAVLREHRLLKARTRLASGENCIKEIAADCGFENIECFYRAFKQATGMSPGKFRDRNNPYALIGK
jgi:AraC-like DNA-binding protein